MPYSAADILAVLHASHDRLAAAVAPLSSGQVRQSAYPTEWSIAQVCSHLGSGAVIFEGLLTAGLTGAPTPRGEDFQAVWDVWNAKSPEAQAADALTAQAHFLAQIDGLDPAQRESFEVELFGAPTDLTRFLRYRLNEHIVHSWDVFVALDPTSTLPADGVALIIDELGPLVAQAGKGTDPARRVEVRTSDPDRALLLSLTPEGAELTELPDSEPVDGLMTLPAEAFVRLIYGRLDPEHTPELAIHGIDLDTLRRAFPGF